MVEHSAFNRRVVGSSPTRGVATIEYDLVVRYKEGNRVIKTVHVGSASSEAGLLKLVKKAQGIIDAEKGKPMFNLDRFNAKK